MTWALARLQTKPVRLLEQMEEQAIPLINTMDTHNCANFLWGFSTLRYAPLQLLPPLASGMLDRGIATSAKPVEVADMAFALSSLASPGQYDDLLITLAGRASPDAALADFSSRQLVVLISALGQLEVVDKLPEGDFDAWIVAIKRAHAATPLQKRDAQTLEEVLKSLGIECGWVKSSEMLAAWKEARSLLPFEPPWVKPEYARAGNYGLPVLCSKGSAIERNGSPWLDLNTFGLPTTNSERAKKADPYGTYPGRGRPPLPPDFVCMPSEAPRRAYAGVRGLF